MKTSVSGLIGRTITEIRFSYVPEDEYGLQEFQSFFKLDNGLIINIPMDPDETWNEYDAHLSDCFSLSKNINPESAARVTNQKITDFYFWYTDDFPDEDQRAVIQLENGLYLSERNFGPIGVTDVDLKIWDEAGFKTFGQSLKDSELRSVGQVNS